jgi:hypothetical protein
MLMQPDTGYSIALEQISLDEFAALLTTIDLLPGRRILLNDLPAVIERLKEEGVRHLAALQKTLKNKARYPDLARTWSVSVDYITVLNREINSYVSKPVPLSALDVFSNDEIERLAQEGLKTTKDLYGQCLMKPARRALSTRLSLPEERIASALELADLLRITGVGPVYAKILREIGIRSVLDYRDMPSQDILERYQRANPGTWARLSIKDVEYCKRFCEKLPAAIEW